MEKCEAQEEQKDTSTSDSGHVEEGSNTTTRHQEVKIRPQSSGSTNFG